MTVVFELELSADQLHLLSTIEVQIASLGRSRRKCNRIETGLTVPHTVHGSLYEGRHVVTTLP
jgi:hypothetical protein